MIRFLLATVVAAAVSTTAEAQLTHVIPNGLAAVEGDSGNGLPWGIGPLGSLKFQSLYDAKNFTLAGIHSPIVITRLRWRANGAATSVTWPTGTYSQATVRMSSTSNSSNAAAPLDIFAGNVGADQTTVYSGPVTVICGSGKGVGVPGPWVTDITLSTPFLYDPASGNGLVISCDIPPGAGSQVPLVFLDVQTKGSQSSRVFSFNAPNSGTGTVTTDHGVVVELTYHKPSGLIAHFLATPSGGPTPLHVQFVDRSFTTDPGGVTSWAWDLDGDGVIDSTQQNPSFVYTQCGSYNVSLTVTDASHPASRLTRIDQVATDGTLARFSYDVIGPGRVLFTDASVGSPTSWAWDLDGDNIVDSTNQNVVFTYASPATPVTVTLTTRRLCGAPSTTTRQVIPMPTLTTQLTAVNFVKSGSVVFFDGNVTNPHGINLTGFDSIFTELPSTKFTVDVFVTPGRFIGKDNVITPWRFAGTATGRTAAPTASAHATLPQPVYLAPGSYGIGLHYVGAAPHCEDATATNSTYANVDLALTLGAARSTAFAGGTFLNAVSWSGTLYYDKLGIGNTAGFGFFGPGCRGTLPVSRQVATNRPILGQTLAVGLDHLPQSAAILLVGLSRTSSPFGQLPFDLTAFGAPGCSLRVRPDAAAPVIGTANAGTFTLPIPNQVGLLGQLLYTQAVVPDPVYALGGVLSDAAAALIGK